MGMFQSAMLEYQRVIPSGEYDYQPFGELNISMF